MEAQGGLLLSELTSAPCSQRVCGVVRIPGHFPWASLSKPTLPGFLGLHDALHRPPLPLTSQGNSCHLAAESHASPACPEEQLELASLLHRCVQLVFARTAHRFPQPLRAGF